MEGWIKLHRQIQQSEVAHYSPCIREVWIYLLRTVQHQQFHELKPGQGYFRIIQIQNDLCWYAGWRKITYSKSEISKALRKLCESNMIETTKATHGILITINQWDFYQGDNDMKETTKDLRKKSTGSNINKNDYKNDKKETPQNNNSPEILSDPIVRAEFRDNFPYVDVTEEVKKMQDWLAATGKKYKDYKAFARNWLRRAQESKPQFNSNRNPS